MMKRLVRAWSLACGTLLSCLPLPSLAKAPVSVKVVRASPQELGAVTDLSPLGDACKSREAVAEQSFRIQQKGAPLDGALFVSMRCNDHPNNAAFGFYRAGKLEQAMPAHPANTWTVYEVESISFPDVNGDGRFEIVTIVSAMSGVGPEGAIPFNVAAVWFQGTNGKWVTDPKADKVLEGVREPDMKKAVAALKKAYAKK